ncbi:MAG: regulatory protein LuxR [Crocinitomicaceae bacterium]|jgi:DNA-binding CsgD family transcriptional regulator|nr:regulatory protein LuxR [Crocinitomicaceae bacterium]
MSIPNDKLQKIYSTWDESDKRAKANTEVSPFDIEKMVGSIVSTGPLYYYVIDFFDMSLSHVSPSIMEIHGFDPKKVTFDDILGTIDPRDLNFVAEAEKSAIDFFYKTVGINKITRYKTNYSFRSRMKNGKYGLLNHQSIQLTVDENGGFGKSLNIHTQIDHLSNENTYRYSLISLDNDVSYMNLCFDSPNDSPCIFTPREIEILQLISEGLDNEAIGEKLFISANTVKKHRKNVLSKSDCKNTAQLIKMCVLEGLI